MEEVAGHRLRLETRLSRSALFSYRIVGLSINSPLPGSDSYERHQVTALEALPSAPRVEEGQRQDSSGLHRRRCNLQHLRALFSQWFQGHFDSTEGNPEVATLVTGPKTLNPIQKKTRPSRKETQTSS